MVGRWARVDLPRRTACLDRTKNGTPRGVPLNGDALAALESQRGQHPVYCFTYKREPIGGDVTNTAWQTALPKAGMTDFRFHDRSLCQVRDRESRDSRLVNRAGTVGLCRRLAHHILSQQQRKTS